MVSTVRRAVGVERRDATGDRRRRRERSVCVVVSVKVPRPDGGEGTHGSKLGRGVESERTKMAGVVSWKAGAFGSSLGRRVFVGDGGEGALGAFAHGGSGSETHGDTYGWWFGSSIRTVGWLVGCWKLLLVDEGLLDLSILEVLLVSVCLLSMFLLMLMTANKIELG